MSNELPALSPGIADLSNLFQLDVGEPVRQSPRRGDVADHQEDASVPPPVADVVDEPRHTAIADANLPDVAAAPSSVRPRTSCCWRCRCDRCAGTQIGIHRSALGSIQRHGRDADRAEAEGQPAAGRGYGGGHERDGDEQQRDDTPREH